MANLGYNHSVVQLARDLKLSTAGDCLAQVEEHTLARIASIVTRWPGPVRTLEMLRSVVAEDLSVNLEFIRSSEDLERIAQDHELSYPGLGLKLNEEFVLDDTEGLLLANPTPQPWERKYLAVIDARGERAARAYFTSWHELTHLIATPAQLSLSGLRRHPTEGERHKDPVEQAVDHIAGRVAFWDPIFRPITEAHTEANNHLQFGQIEAIRVSASPDASLLATSLACLRLSRVPTILVVVGLALKAGELRQVQAPKLALLPGGRVEPSTARVRLVRCIPNDAVRHSRVRVFRNMRVPTRSVLFDAYEACSDVELAADEDQSWWDTSNGGSLPPRPLYVRAVRRGSHVYGLISPAAVPR